MQNSFGKKRKSDIDIEYLSLYDTNTDDTTDSLTSHLESLNINTNTNTNFRIKRSKKCNNISLLDDSKIINKNNIKQVFNLINHRLDITQFNINIKLYHLDSKLKNLESNISRLKTCLIYDKNIDHSCSYIN